MFIVSYTRRVKRLVAAFLLLGSASFPAEKKRHAPEVEVVEISVRRAGPNITLDGKVRNVSDKPQHGLNVLFDFGGTEHQVISSNKTAVAGEDVAPQDEEEFHVQTPDLARAVEVTVRAEDKNDKVLRVDKAGPYPIE